MTRMTLFRVLAAILAAGALGCSSKENVAESAQASSTATLTSEAPKPKEEKQSYGDPRCKDECSEMGACTFRGAGKPCTPVTDADCEQSYYCKEEGNCHVRVLYEDIAICEAATPGDCLKSLHCKTKGKCKLVDRKCVEGTGGTAKINNIPKPRYAGGMQWTVDGRLAGLVEIVKVTCETRRSYKLCQMTARLPQGSAALPRIQGYVYDTAGTKVDFAPMGSLVRGVEPGETVQEEVTITAGDAVQMVIKQM